MRPSLFLLLLAACASAPTIPFDRQPLTLSLQNVACSSCGKEIEDLALEQPGVKGATYDAARVELHLELLAGTAPEAIIGALQAHPIDGKQLRVVVGEGQGSYAPF